MAAAVLQQYLDLSRKQIYIQLKDIVSRNAPSPGKKQVPFNAIETLLCYGLFSLVDPHHYGGKNIDRVPAIVNTLAFFFKRTPGSILSKMLNLDGSRKHSAREEPLLFASLALQPERFLDLYKEILMAARNLGIGEETLPDFLEALQMGTVNDVLLGQDDLPQGTSLLLSGADQHLEEVERTFRLGDLLTEKLVERKIRLAQHRFALQVLRNCGRACVFCGFAPHTLPERSGLLRASHIKPWAVSNQRERVDVQNGLAACPVHDAAFDQGYITVDEVNQIKKAKILQESIIHDVHSVWFFENILSKTLVLPETAILPGKHYLEYHRCHCFRDQEIIQ